MVRDFLARSFQGKDWKKSGPTLFFILLLVLLKQLISSYIPLKDYILIMGQMKSHL